jgi:hypothetical protein
MMIPIMTYIIGLPIPIILLRSKSMLEIAVGPAIESNSIHTAPDL